MQYCIKYLYLKYFLVVKGLGSPKFPCMSHTPPSVKHVPMLSEVVKGIWDRKTGTGLHVWVLGRHRQDAQHNSTTQQMGGSHLLPLGASPMQGVNQYGHLAHTALQFFIFFYYSSIQQWYNVTISQYIITYHTSHLIACSCSQLCN